MNKRIGIIVDDLVLKAIDKYCEFQRLSRSEFLVMAAKEFSHNHPAITDFHAIRPSLSVDKPFVPAANYIDPKLGHCEALGCKSHEGQLCRVTYPVDQGEETRKKYMCAFHVRQAEREGLDILYIRQ